MVSRGTIYVVFSDKQLLASIVRAADRMKQQQQNNCTRRGLDLDDQTRAEILDCVHTATGAA